MKAFSKIFPTLVLLFCTLPILAQNLVSGVVTDENGAPLIGAGVFVKGTSGGVVTDAEGAYSIAAAPTAILSFSYIGYAPQEIPVAGHKQVNVQLLPDTKMLDEVVVVGYGTMKRSDLTGAISSVGEKSLHDYKTSSVMEALGGQIAGVNITASDGTPGAGFDVKIRGVGTVNGNYAPLYIVDGFEVDNIDYLASQDIKSIEVLKDASASAIYGARAANGVILVTTKGGKEGRPQIAYNGSASYRVLPRTLNVLTPYEFVNLQLQINPERYGSTYFNPGVDEQGNPYRYTSAEDYRSLAGIDWQKRGFRPTWSQNHDVSVAGGRKGSSYSVSFSHFDEQGLFNNSGFKKNAARIKLGQVITDWLKFDGSVNYTRLDRYGSTGNGRTLVNLIAYRPTGDLRVSENDLLNNLYDPLSLAQTNFDPNTVNPLLQSEAVDQKRTDDQWIASGSLTATIIEGLTFRTIATFNMDYRRQDYFYGENSSQAYAAKSPYGQSQVSKIGRASNSNILSYKKNFTRRHKTEFMLGEESSLSFDEYVLAQAKDFPFDQFGVDNLGLGATPSLTTSSKSRSNRLSFFVRVFYSFDDRFMLTGTARSDASTVFAPKNKWGFFPSFAGAWTISNEKFMRPARHWLSLMKLRVGWGIVGNDRIASFLSMDLYTPVKYGNGLSQETVLTPKQIANRNLRWEGSMTTNIGLDLAFLENRITLNLDVFRKDTKDLLLAQNLANVTGFDFQWQNIGKIRNEGIELTLNSVNINKRNFFWSTSFNISFIKNTLLSLQSGTDYIFARSGFNSNFADNDYIARVGSSLGDMYGYVFDGVYQVSDFNKTPEGLQLKFGIPDISGLAGRPTEAGMVKFRDINGDGIITTDDRTKIGNGQPDFYGGLTNTFNFYGVDLSFMLQFTYGNDIYNATRMFLCQSNEERVNRLAEVRDAWTPSNASNRVPKYDGYIPGIFYSRFVEDGSFLRLKNLTLGYSLPSRWTSAIYLSKVRAYVSMQNLFCLTRYSGYDPEVNTQSSPLMPGLDWGAYPKSRVYTFGIELQF